MRYTEDYMLLLERQAMQLTSVPGFTAVIPTYNSSPRLFALSLLSLLRNSADVLEHVIVTINGPDRRTGNPETQDIKQEFLEQIREEKYRGKDMPLTVQRTWSRVGHAQSLDSAMPWVHTQNVLCMHDDVLVLDPGWGSVVTRCLENPDAGLVIAGEPKALNRVTWGPWEDGRTLVNFPHPRTHFVAARREVIGTYRWAGYFTKGDFRTTATAEYLREFQEGVGQSVQSGELPKELGYITHDIGSWLMFHLQNDGQQILSIPEETVLHFAGFSWKEQRENVRKVNKYVGIIDRMEVGLREELPNLFKLYFDMFGDHPFC